MCLTLLRDSPAGILRALAAGDTEEDPFLLSALFPAAAKGFGISKTPANKPGKKRIPVPEPPPRSPPRYRVTRIAGGFSVKGVGGAVAAPAQLLIACAYEVRRRNPLKCFRPWDFSLVDGSIAVTLEGAQLIESDENHLRIAPEDTEFHLSLTGFDPNRNLFVRVS